MSEVSSTDLGIEDADQGIHKVAERGDELFPDDTMPFDPSSTAATTDTEPLEVAPEGWATNKGVARELGFGRKPIRSLASSLREERPEWFRTYKDAIGHPREHYHPDLVEYLSAEMLSRKNAPESWATVGKLARQLGLAEGTVKGICEEIQQEHPDWARELRNKGGNVYTHYSPEIVQALQDKLSSAEPQQEGWMTAGALKSAINIAHTIITKTAEQYREEHPEWFQQFKQSSGRVHEHYHPALVLLIKGGLAERSIEAEGGWCINNQLARELGVDEGTVRRAAEQYREEHPEWFKTFSLKGNPYEHYSPELNTLIGKEIGSRRSRPDGWLTYYGLAEELGVAIHTAKRIAEKHREEHPEWFATYKNDASRMSEHIHPDLAAEIRSNVSDRSLERKNHQDRKELEQAARSFLVEIGEGESLEAQEFEQLVNLFGAERVVDILYHSRPETKELPVPYINSALTEYLGDYLAVRGEFSLENLEKGVGLLVNPNFRESLTEIIKADVLHLLNQVGRVDLDTVNEETVAEYLAHIRSETEGFVTPELEEILDEVEAYYQLLFENIHKPDRFVDELGEGRLFPDINQRINVQEIAFKRRMLIADEMGTGKSASAIMAKEILGVSQALIVVPSNVVEVWENYLSDKVDENGKQIGYFKPGEAPSYLVVDSLEALEGVKPGDYEYVIISHERLNQDYVDSLGALNYGMLIVDEVHKLKNIASGKRAECLIELAEQVSGEDKYLALLSGTPVPNKISDVALTLKLLYPEQFSEISNKELVSQIINGDMLDLRSLLVPRMQMKSLSEAIEMPDLTEEVVHFELSPEEQEIYGMLVDEDELTASEKLRVLRQFILNPRLIDATPGIESAKLAAVSSALRETFSEKDKVVMFVNGYIEGVMRGEGSVLDDLDIPEGVDVMSIDGSVSKEDRLAIQEELKRTGQKVLLVVSGQTADVGVDFSAAQEVYFYNEPWTEYDKLQQRGRVYRPGLSGDLKVRTFIAAGTIEDGIHKYIQTKYEAVEKLLRGIPISEIEKVMLQESEKQSDPNLEVNAELAEYYFSSWDKMMRIYGHVKELGEEDFKRFLTKYDAEYAESYANLVGSRSYQANVARLSGTLLNTFVGERGQNPRQVRILDVASGPQMLKRHIPEELGDSVVSMDINRRHFEGGEGQHIVGSFVNLPISDDSVDYVNLSLGLHYTSFAPSRGKPERLKVLQELNRVLAPGGRGIIDMIYSLDLTHDEAFVHAIDKLGFKIVEEYSGVATSDNNFRSQVITVEKVRDCTRNTKELLGEIGPEGVKALKFKKSKASIHDARKIVTAFDIGKSVVQGHFNPSDQAALEEEQEFLAEMENLKKQYGRVKDIPREVVIRSGLARIFNGKRYVLFKRLDSGNGAVIIR